MAEAANDVLSNGIVEHEDEVEVTQTPQARPALDRMTSAEPGSKAQVRNIPMNKARDWEANMRMNRVEHPRHVGLQSPREPAQLRHARCSQPSRLEAPGSRAKRSPSTATARQIIMTPQELSMLVKMEVLRALAKIGASEETISKAVDDDWAFAEEETEQTRKTNAGSTGSAASDEPAAQDKTSKGTQCTTSTQGKAEEAETPHNMWQPNHPVANSAATKNTAPTTNANIWEPRRFQAAFAVTAYKASNKNTTIWEASKKLRSK